MHSKGTGFRFRGKDDLEGQCKPSMTSSEYTDVLRLADIGFDACVAFLAQHGLKLIRVEDGAPIPGS